MIKDRKKNVLIPRRYGKPLVIDESLIDKSIFGPKDLMKNPLKVHEPLSREIKPVPSKKELLNIMKTITKKIQF